MFDIATFMPGIIAAYAILLIGASSPGPSVAMVIGVATRQGRSSALTATLGIALGSVTINILTMLGVGIVLSQAAWAMSLLRFVGAAYLLYLSYGAFRRAMNPPELQSVNTGSKTFLKLFIAGYLLQVTNPKTISFWLAIASIGAVEGATIGVIIVFVIGAFVISFVCHGAWAVALSTQRVREAYIDKRKCIEAALGGFLAFAAYKLATSEN